MIAHVRKDDERHEYKRLHGQLQALDEDIRVAQEDLQRLTSAHFEGFFRHRPVAPRGSIEGEHVQLRDGSTVVIRTVQPADSSLVKDGFEHLGAVNRYRQFVFDREHLSDSEAAEITAVDHRDHEALGAIDPETGAAVGLARYVRERSDPTRAVVAVFVVDSWQGRGLATRLLQRLARRAIAAGIEHFDAHMIVGDTSAQRMFESVGTLETTQRAAGVVDVTVRLSD
jgi:GNAT superfamily N-acetyltransferase